jgi:AraC-like DNA-binding protein
MAFAMECGIGVSVDRSTGPVRTVAALCVPPRDAAEAVTTHPGGRTTLSWQRFEDPSGHGAVQFTRVAWLGIGRVRAAAHRVVNDPRQFGSASGSDIHVVLQLSGTSVLEQRGDTLTLEPGDWAAPRADSPYAMTCRERTERLILAIGRKHLAAELTSTQWAGRVFSAASGTGRLFFSTAVCLADELPYIQISQAQTLANQLTALLHVALLQEISCGPVDESTLRRDRVNRYIAQHLRDPQLTVERIAADLGASSRTLARVFAPHGETLMEYVYHQRLEGVRRDLLNPMLEEHSLADIARSWGFVNYTHFSDRFRTHFGVTATAVRRRAKAARAIASQYG